jgi:hypothetical protein
MSANWPTTDQVFILRFWKEEGGADRKLKWRVQVQNVNTRRRQVVDDVDRAFALVTARLIAASDDEAGGTGDA